MTRRTQMLRIRRPARDAVACDLFTDGRDQTQMLRMRRLSEVRRACARRDTGDGTSGLRACRVEPLRSSAFGRFAFAPHARLVAKIWQSLVYGRFAFAVPRMRGGEGKSNRPKPACDAVACELFSDSRDQTQMLRIRRLSEVRRACARRDTGDGTSGLRAYRVEPLRSLVLGWFAFAPHARLVAKIWQSLVYGRFAFAVPRMRGGEGKSNRPNPARDAVACDLFPDGRDQTQMLRMRRLSEVRRACARRNTGDGTSGLRACRVEPLRSSALGRFAFAPHAYPVAEIRQSLVYGRFAFAVPRIMRGGEGKSNRPNPARDAVVCVSSLFVSFT